MAVCERDHFLFSEFAIVLLCFCLTITPKEQLRLMTARPPTKHRLFHSETRLLLPHAENVPCCLVFKETLKFKETPLLTLLNCVQQKILPSFALNFLTWHGTGTSKNPGPTSGSVSCGQRSVRTNADTGGRHTAGGEDRRGPRWTTGLGPERRAVGPQTKVAAGYLHPGGTAAFA